MGFKRFSSMKFSFILEYEVKLQARLPLQGDYVGLFFLFKPCRGISSFTTEFTYYGHD